MEVVLLELVGGKTYSFDLSKPVITLGRDETNDIALNDKNVSRKHAQISRQGDAYALTDLNSTNGTFVNGSRVSHEVLRDGDTLALGSSILTFRFAKKGTKSTEEETEKEQQRSTQNIISCIKLPRSPDGKALGSFDFPKASFSAEKASANLKVLFEMTKLFKGVFDPSQVLERAMDKVAEIMNADAVCLFLHNEKTDSCELAISKSHAPNQLVAAPRVSSTILERATKNFEAVLCYDTSQDSRFGATESIIQKHILSSMCVPLWNNERVIGAIYLHNTLAAHAFSEEDLHFLSILARHISDVLENLQLYEQVRQKERLDAELGVARQIQQQLLPQEFPLDPRIEFSALNVPAREVGGDLYDVIPVEPAKYLLVIGDVAGKGVPAALFMSAIRSIIRSQTVEACDLEKIMNKSNTLVESDSKEGMFITLFCALVDSNTMTLRFVNAGHNPPILYRASTQSLESLKASGKPLGVLPDLDYSSSSLELTSGDLLLCYTDGITEALNPDKEMFGLPRLEQAVHKYASLSAADIIQRIVQEVNAFAHGREQSDDLTLLAARIKPS